MKKYSTILTIGGLFLGIILGFIFPTFIQSISFIGQIYINLLKFMIIPVIFTSIISVFYKSSLNKSKLLFKVISLFIIMFSITFLLTSLVVLLVKPGINYSFIPTVWNDEITTFQIGTILTNIFPTNIIAIFENNLVLPAIILAAFSGYAASKIKDGNKLIDIINILKDLCNKLLEYIMYLTPIAVLSLVGNVIANYGNIIFTVGAKYILIAFICSILCLILVMIIPVWVYAKINPITYIKKTAKIWLMTITTCSSSATLPYTIKTCENDLKVNENVTNLVVPLGCTIHMCGGAVSFALLGLFCSQLFGIEINFYTFIIMIISSNLINMAAPGIPNGGIVIGATYLSILNIPLSFIGFYSGIYKILDMMYTTLNVTGDITANVLINTYLNKKKTIRK